MIDATNSPSTTYYDAVGNVTGMRDGNNLLTQYQVDSLNRVTVTIDPRNYRTTTQFDAVGNITAITDASNNTSTFAYDSLNRKVTETDALGNSATFAYNAVGLLTSSTDRLGRRRDFGYDLLNRRTTEIWYSSGGSATETMTYSFDAGGNQLTATNSDGTYTMTYNELNQVTQVEDLWGNILTFTYDDAGNRTIVEDSEGGVETSTYDAANNLTWREISGIGSSHIHIEIDYDSRNQIEIIRRYTGSMGPFTSISTSDYSYNARQQIETIAHSYKGSVGAGTFQVSSFAATETGFEVSFNREIQWNQILNLFNSDDYDERDVILVGDGADNTFDTGDDVKIFGSLVLSSDLTAMTFVKTGPRNASAGDGLLAADTYRVTLKSWSDGTGFRDASHAILDGDADNTAGGDYVTTFTVAAPASDVVNVGITDFMRGPGQSVNVPATSSDGIPLILSTGQDVSDVELELRWDPDLLTIGSGAFTVNPAISANTVTFTIVSAGYATLQVSKTSEFTSSSGQLTLGHLTASVPDTAPYGEEQVLDITCPLPNSGHICCQINGV